MNSVNLIGRLTKDTEIAAVGENKYVRFTLAVNRKFKNAEGEYDADFISCVAWNKTAEIINEHFKKGSEIGIEGRIQTGSYDKEDGSKVYTTDVIVENITFIGSKKEGIPAPEYVGQTEKTDAEILKDVVNDVDPYASFGEQIEINDADLPF